MKLVIVMLVIVINIGFAYTPTYKYTPKYKIGTCLSDTSRHSSWYHKTACITDILPNYNGVKCAYKLEFKDYDSNDDMFDCEYVDYMSIDINNKNELNKYLSKLWLEEEAINNVQKYNSGDCVKMKHDGFIWYIANINYTENSYILMGWFTNGWGNPVVQKFSVTNNLGILTDCPRK